MSTKTTRREFLKQAAAGATAVAVATVLPASNGGWKCLYCGTVNPAGADRCGEGTTHGCGASRPIGEADGNEGVSSIQASVTKRVCAICGKSPKDDPWLDLVALINPFVPEKAELVWVCRHGHFNATIIDAFTGMPVMMTGPDSRPPTLVVFNEDWRRKNQL